MSSNKTFNSAVILACVRDCEQYLPTSLKNIEAIGNLFSEYDVFFYENDSIDKTKDILQEACQKNTNMHLISTTLTGQKSKYRTWRLATARQTLLDTLITNNKSYDYVIVIDPDDVACNNPFNGTHFISEALKKHDLWDGCFPKLTYDYWAYRTGIDTSNYWELYLLDKLKFVSRGAHARYANHLKYMSNTNYNMQGLQIVASAFNGIGIYKYKTYITGKYSGENIYFTSLSDNQKNAILNFVKKTDNPLRPQDLYMINSRLKEECEHVNFHYSLSKNTCTLCCLNTSPYP